MSIFGEQKPDFYFVFFFFLFFFCLCVKYLVQEMELGAFAGDEISCEFHIRTCLQIGLLGVVIQS